MPLDSTPLSPGDIWQSPSLSTAEAEQALLGSLLCSNALFDQVYLLVVASDFSVPLHGRIYDLIGQLHPTPIPEPGSLGLLATAVAALLWRLK